MPVLSVSEAARRTGASRSTIHRKLKSGEISAIRRKDGSRGIDTAELVRVFGELRGTGDQQHTPIQLSTGGGTAVQLEVARLQGDVRVLTREIELLRQQLEDARRQLDAAQADKRELFKLANQERLPAPSWWARLFS